MKYKKEVYFRIKCSINDIKNICTQNGIDMNTLFGLIRPKGGV